MTTWSSSTHKCCSRSSLRRSEADVQRVLGSFNNFVNPFKLSEETKDKLYCVSSGVPASESVCTDLLAYEAKGEAAAKAFIDERLASKQVSFHDTMKKFKLHKFKSMAASKTQLVSKRLTVSKQSTVYLANY